MSLGYMVPNAVGLNPLQWSGTWADVDDGWNGIDADPEVIGHDNDGTTINIGFTIVSVIRFNTTAWTYSTATISKVEVAMHNRGTSTSLTLQPLLYLGGTLSYGTATNTPTSYAGTPVIEEITRPGGGSWSVGDLADLQVGLRQGGPFGKSDKAYCSHLYLIVTYTTGAVTETVTIDSDSHIKKIDTKTIDSDSLVVVTKTSTIDSDSHIKKIDTKTIDSNSHIFKTDTKTIDSDSIVVIEETVTIDSDSVVSATQINYRPESDEHITTSGMWSPTSGTDLYAMIDEVSANDYDRVEGDSNLISSLPEFLTFGNTDTTVIPGGRWLNIFIRAASNSPLRDHTLKGAIYHGTTEYETVGTVDINDSISYLDKTLVFQGCPYGDSWGAINTFDVGIALQNDSGPSGEIRISQLYWYFTGVTDTKTIDSDSYIFRTDTTTIDSDSHIKGTETVTIDSDGWVGTYDPTWYSGSVYYSRQQIDFGVNHQTLPIGYTADVELYTGYEMTIADNGTANESIQHSARCIGYSSTYDTTYFTWLGQPAGGSSFYIYVNKYDHNTSTLATPIQVVSAGSSLDTHYAPTLLLDSDGRLHLFYGSHNSEQEYIKSTNVNDIENWDSPTVLGVGDSVTYPRVIEDDSGDIYVFCRGSNFNTGSAGAKYAGFYKSDDKGNTWDDFKILADYSVNESGAAKASIYCGGVVYKDGRCHIVYTFWDFYLNVNKGRRISYMYSDDFIEWKDVDGAVMADTSETYKVLTYSSGSAAVVDSPNFPSAGPYYHTNTEGLAVDDNHHPYFLYQEWSTYIREECDMSIAFHDGTSWTITNLSELTDAPKMYYYRAGSSIIFDSGKLYCYAFVRPEVGVDYSGAEIYRWIGWNSATTWTHGQLTRNTGDGIGMMSVLPNPTSRGRELIYSRSRNVAWLQDLNYAKVQNSGDDVRIVRQTHDPDTDTTYSYELHRLPDRFNAQDTKIFWKLDAAVPSGSAWPAFDNRYWIYYNAPLAVDAPNDSDEIFNYYENFENYVHNRGLTNLPDWADSEPPPD